MSQGSPYPYPPPLEYAPAKPGRRWKKVVGWSLLIGLAIAFVLLLNNTHSNYQSTSLNKLRDDLFVGNVRSVSIEGDDVTWIPVKAPAALGNMPNAVGWRTSLPTGASSNWAFTEWLLEHANGAQVYVNNNQNLLLNLVVPLIPWLAVFAFIYLFVFRQLRKRTAQATPPPFAAAPPYIAAPPYATPQVPPNYPR